MKQFILHHLSFLIYYQNSSVLHLAQEENKISNGVDGCHPKSVFHQDHEGITGRGAETGAVYGRRRISILETDDKNY